MAKSLKLFVSEGEINSGATATWRSTITPTQIRNKAYNKGLPKYAKLTDVTIHWEWKTNILINATSKCTINGTQVGNTSSTNNKWTNVTISSLQKYFKSGTKYPGESIGNVVWEFSGTLRTYYARNWYFLFTYTPPTFVVSATVQGQGSVSGTGTYDVGSTATLTATPATGYRFVKWSDGNTSATRTVTVTQDDISANVTNLSYTAVFEKLTYAIAASAGAGGTISPSGSTQVSHGDSQTYTITPNEGYEIESVTVDGVNQGAVSSFTFSNVTSAHTISVTFRQIPTYYLDLNGMLDGASSGGISPYGTADVYINGVLTSNDCVDFWMAYPAGTTYEIKDIKANDGYQYDGVYSGTLSGTITATTSVVLSFSTVVKPPEFTSASLTYAGSQVSQNNKVPAGESCILSVGVT